MSGLTLSLSTRPRRRRRGFQPPYNAKLKGWLRVGGWTDTGTLTIPDLLNNNPAVQATAARKPTVNTSNNGLPILDFVDDLLSWPLATYNNGAVKFGFGTHIKLANVTGNKSIVSTLSTPGGASANKFNALANAAVLRIDDSTVDRHAASGNLDTAWRFVYIGIDCSKGTETTQVLHAIDTTLQAVAFSSDTAWSSNMGTPTGNMLIGALTTAAASPFVGSMGPNFYWFDDQLTLAEIADYAGYERPT